MKLVHKLSDSLQIRTAELAVASALRLCRVQSNSGLYLYEYDAVKNVPSNKNYSMVRMAGSAYSMCWAAESFAGTRAGEVILISARKAIDFLLRACQFAEPAYYVCDFSFEAGMRRRGATGATALLINAVLFSPFRDEFDVPLQRLVHTLLLSQTTAGGIRASLSSAANLGSQRYYPGETLLALVRYGAAFNNEEVLDRLKPSLDFYRNYFSVDSHLGMVLWHVDCWTRMARLSHERNDAEFCRSCLGFCRQLLRRITASMQNWSAFRQSPEPQNAPLRIGASTALYVEALSRYIQCSDLIDGQEADLAALKAGLSDGLYCLERLQLGEQLHGREVDRRLALGGCQSSMGSGHLRMDNDQHLITACLAVIENEYLKDENLGTTKTKGEAVDAT